MDLVAVHTIDSGRNKKLPGSKFSVDEQEAKRLISLGAAKVDNSIKEVQSEEPATDSALDDKITELLEITGVTKSIAVILLQNGFESVSDVAGADPTKLCKIKGITVAAAKVIVDSANNDFE